MTIVKLLKRSPFWVSCVVLVLCWAAVVPAQVCVSGTNAALSCDGVDDWVRVPDDAALDGFADFTIEFWCRPGTNLNQGLVSKFRHASSSNDDDAYSIRVYPPGVLRVQLASGTVTSFSTWPAGTVPGMPITYRSASIRTTTTAPVSTLL